MSTPGVIARNTAWLTVAQLFSGAGTSFFFALGPLMVLSLTGSSALTGLTVALQGTGRLLAAYPFGRITDRYGRRPGLLIALAITLAGTVAIGASMLVRSLPFFIIAVSVFCIGTNGMQQLRVAAAEMYPPRRRAFALGVVLTGTIIGVVASPAIVGLAHTLAPGLGVDELALPWLFAPALMIPAAFSVLRIHPDPRAIAAELHRYYPEYEPLASDGSHGAFGLGTFFADPQRRVAAAAMFGAHGSMQIAMVTAPIILAHHSTITLVALSMSLHTAGMFGPSIPMGWLADRFGRRSVLVAGIVVESVGGGLAAFGSDHLVITIGVILVGVGWCAANISSTAIVVDTTGTAVRGQAIGFIDTIAAVSGIAFPLAAGPMVDRWGVGSTGIMAVVLFAIPVFMLLRLGHTVTRRGPVELDAVTAGK